MQEDNTISVLITGDYCPIGRNEQKIANADYSFMEPIKEISKKADLVITNLEAPVTASSNKLIKSGPNIKVGEKALLPLTKAGFKLVTLANNHILDYSEAGLKDTISACEKNNIDWVGAGKNLGQARKPVIYNIKGKKIGILNFAENEFCAAKKNAYGANPINPITNYQDIQETKKKVDYLLVIAHGGREHYQLPTPKQRERYRFYADAGADAVIGHHSHCFSGYEIHNQVPIFYSLGNFIFDYKKKYQKGKWTQGFALTLNLGEKIDFQLIPYFQGREANPDLTLLNEDEKIEFFKTINNLNESITNDEIFHQKWDTYIESQKRGYKGLLFIQNDYIRAAISRKLLPNWFFHSERHKTLLLNLLRCETHREIMSDVLEKEHGE